MKHTIFNSRLGMVLATAGAAVGLGNIWRFPTTAGENGGAAFILVYIIFNIILGIPAMVSEIMVGRSSGRNSFRSYSKAGGNYLWGLTGIMGMICGSIILGFYSVVAGWCLYYLFLALGDNVLVSQDQMQATFGNIAGTPWLSALVAIVILMITHGIIIRGIRRGIEKASRIMMPMLFVLILVLIGASFTLDGAMDGLYFLFHPDFSKITPTVMYEAIGQSFFSLSLGSACLCTYGAYFHKEANLLKTSVQIAGVNCSVDLLAGIMIFPAAFAVGIQPDAGPSLIFLTLPNVFQMAFPHYVAYVVSVIFFALLTVAALTSTISLHEIGTSLITEEMHTTRSRAAICVTAFCTVISILSAVSMGPEPIGFFGATLFDNFDGLTSNILLPLGTIITTLLVGWRMSRQRILEELTSNGRYRWAPWAINVYFFLIRFVVPTCIAIVVLSRFEVI